jgi:hypothetical protein
MSIYYTYIDINVIIIIIYKFLKRILCCEILQILCSGTPPTRMKVYIDTHTQPGDKYPNDEVRARVVWFLHVTFKHLCLLAYLFMINNYLGSLAWLNLFNIGELFLIYP